MQIRINTDSSIEGREAMVAHFQGVVENVLNRFRDRITTVEVHLSDVNGDKGGPADKRCMIEARLENRKPTAVTHEAGTLDAAVDGAADKMARSLESATERLRERH